MPEFRQPFHLSLYNIAHEIRICLFYPRLKVILPYQLFENNWVMFLVLTLVKYETGNTENSGNTTTDKYKPRIPFTHDLVSGTAALQENIKTQAQDFLKKYFLMW